MACLSPQEYQLAQSIHETYGNTVFSKENCDAQGTLYDNTRSVLKVPDACTSHPSFVTILEDQRAALLARGPPPPFDPVSSPISSEPTDDSMDEDSMDLLSEDEPSKWVRFSEDSNFYRHSTSAP